MKWKKVNVNMSKTDCFAYRTGMSKYNVWEECDAYTKMMCKDGGKCKHYKIEKELCEACKKGKGRRITCEECRKIRKVCKVET